MSSARPERLEALRRQRATIAQHLAWLDEEISASSGDPPPPAKTAPPLTGVPEKTHPVSANAGPPPLLVSEKPAALTPASSSGMASALSAEGEKVAPSQGLDLANQRAESILEEYATTDRFNPDSTRRGCILFVAAVFALGVAFLLIIYAVRYR